MVAFNNNTEPPLTAAENKTCALLTKVAEKEYDSIPDHHHAILLELNSKNNDVIRSIAGLYACPNMAKRLMFAQIAQQVALLTALCADDDLDYAMLVPFMADALTQCEDE